MTGESISHCPSNPEDAAKKIACIQQIKVANIVNRLGHIKWKQIGQGKRQILEDLRDIKRTIRESSPPEHKILDWLRFSFSVVAKPDLVAEIVRTVMAFMESTHFPALINFAQNVYVDSVEKLQKDGTSNAKWIIQKLDEDERKRPSKDKSYQRMINVVIQKNIRLDVVNIDEFVHEAVLKTSLILREVGLLVEENLCRLCDRYGHAEEDCSMTATRKVSLIGEKHLCVSCFSSKHSKERCTNPSKCGDCGGAHHQSICTSHPSWKEFIGFIMPDERRSCPYCSENHMATQCTLSSHAKKVLIEVQDSCLRCLGKTHTKQDCHHQLDCKICRGDHFYTHCDRLENFGEDSLEQAQLRGIAPEEFERIVRKYELRNLQKAEQLMKTIKKLKEPWTSTPYKYCNATNHDATRCEEDVDTKKMLFTQKKLCSHSPSNQHASRTCNMKSSCKWCGEEHLRDLCQPSDVEELYDVKEEETPRNLEQEDSKGDVAEIPNDESCISTQRLPQKQLDDEESVVNDENSSESCMVDPSDQQEDHQSINRTKEHSVTTSDLSSEVVPENSLELTNCPCPVTFDMSKDTAQFVVAPSSRCPRRHSPSSSQTSSFSPKEDFGIKEHQVTTHVRQRIQMPHQDHTQLHQCNDQKDTRSYVLKHKTEDGPEVASEAEDSSSDETDYDDAPRKKLGPRPCHVICFHTQATNFIESNIFMRFVDKDIFKIRKIGRICQFYRQADHWTNTKDGVMQSATAAREFEKRMERSFVPTHVHFIHQSPYLTEKLDDEDEEFFKEVQKKLTGGYNPLVLFTESEEEIPRFESPDVINHLFIGNITRLWRSNPSRRRRLPTYQDELAAQSPQGESFPPTTTEEFAEVSPQIVEVSTTTEAPATQRKVAITVNDLTRVGVVPTCLIAFQSQCDDFYQSNVFIVYEETGVKKIQQICRSRYIRINGEEHKAAEDSGYVIKDVTRFMDARPSNLEVQGIYILDELSPSATKLDDPSHQCSSASTTAENQFMESMDIPSPSQSTEDHRKFVNEVWNSINAQAALSGLYTSMPGPGNGSCEELEPIVGSALHGEAQPTFLHQLRKAGSF